MDCLSVFVCLSLLFEPGEWHTDLSSIVCFYFVHFIVFKCGSP